MSNFADWVLLSATGAAAFVLAWTLAEVRSYRRSRNRTRAKLREVRSRLANAIEGSNLAVWDWTVADDRVYLSEAWAAMLGGAPQETVTTAAELMALVPAEDLPRVKAAVASVMQGESDRYAVEHRVRSLDGGWKWFNTRGKVVAREAEGRVTRMTGTNADITARKRAERELRESEQELRLIANAVPAMIAYVDREERYRFHNRAFEQWIGLGGGQISGHTTSEVLGADTYRFVEPYIRRALAGETVHYERRQVSHDGRACDLAVSYVPHLAEHGAVRGYYALLTDITGLKDLDRLKSEFVTTVSHELRTPLTAIRASLGLLHAGATGSLPESAAKLIDIAYTSCERLVRLVNDILDVEKIEAGQMTFDLKPIELVALVRQALAANESFAAECGVRLELVAAPPMVRIEADADRLLQALTNLLSNAAKFTLRESAVEVAIAQCAQSVRVQVRDRGPGIAHAFEARLFQKFAQDGIPTLGSTKGAGLGLAISKAIVERHGGRIGFEPAPGGGTVFYFELPAAQAVQAVQAAQAAGATPSPAAERAGGAGGAG